MIFRKYHWDNVQVKSSFEWMGTSSIEDNCLYYLLDFFSIVAIWWMDEWYVSQTFFLKEIILKNTMDHYYFFHRYFWSSLIDYETVSWSLSLIL